MVAEIVVILQGHLKILLDQLLLLVEDLHQHLEEYIHHLHLQEALLVLLVQEALFQVM